MTSLIVVVLITVFSAVTPASVLPRSKSSDCADSSQQCYDQRLHPAFTPSRRASKNLVNEVESKYWLDNAIKFVEDKTKQKENTNIAKNVIFFLGDGMSVPTISATRVIMGGEEQQLAFEKFPHTGLSKTYCLDKKVPDSASTATAYLAGVKANYGTIGVNGQIPRGDCSNILDQTKHTPSIAKWAQDAGKATGIVTTTRITHASPAGNYAHVADRNWESNSDLPEGCPAGVDIASQLVYGEVGRKFKVIFGGGRREFINDTVVDMENKPGRRTDGKNLIREWIDTEPGREAVFDRQSLMNINSNSTDTILGLFQDTHMLYHLEAKNMHLEAEKPTLEEMTRKAIEILEKSEKGYYLFVEGGKIDLAHHDVYARIALDETVEFSKAIQAAVDMTDEKDTLIVVTSDHAHTMSFAGYPVRGNDIYGMPGKIADDNLPYMTLSYANGNGYEKYMDDVTSQRLPFLSGDADDFMQKFPSTVPVNSETHGGEDVGVFAKGPWSHLFTSTYEQNVIPHLVAYAACIGDGLKACDQ